ncbi:MAG: AAA family ATPase [Hyphomicrobiaceae bacterium]|nr:AAA family ATPase [Hyphomicrobiaceae bacterium]
MTLTSISIQGYRSVRKLTLPVRRLSVFVGGNGVGKTNLYKALGLLRAAADGTITRSIADEGGIESVLWAGQRRRGEPARIILKAEFDELCYGVEVGLPVYELDHGVRTPMEAAFLNEPRVKEERLILRQGRRDVVMMERKGPLVTIRNEKGARETIPDAVLPSETALDTFRDSARYPELDAVRRDMLGWRLYHDFRTDAASPIRQPCHAITTPTLSADGHDLAAVLATLFVIRQDTAEIAAAIDDAFPGAQLWAGDTGSHCSFTLRFPEMPRAFAAHELSDGTLKYLCLLGALMAYRIPPLVALNEPEASLHPLLLPPLARLIAKAAERAGIWIVTHSTELAAALEEEAGARPRRVVKDGGETRIEGLRVSGFFDDDD